MKNLLQDNVQSLLLNVLMNDCDEMITIKSLDLKYLDCNKAFMRHIGIENREEIINKPIKDVIPKKNFEIIQEKINKILETGSLQPYTFEIETNNIKRTVQQVSTPIIQENQIKYILTISRDITQDELLKSNLAVKTNQLNTLMEYLPLLVYMKDKDKNYIIGSKHAKNFVEQGIDPYANNVHICMSESTKDTLEEDNFVLENKQILSKEKLCWDYSGNEHWYKILKAPILNKDNLIDGLVTIAQNIDNDKLIENQKDLFIATLVHDLKNPLLAQISGMKLLQQGYFQELNNEQKEMLDTIIESANYMKEMLYTLINTYRYDNGNVTLNKSEIDINNLITTCIKEHSSLAKEYDVSIKFISSLKEQDKYIKIDEKQIRRVLCNLLNNGINYAYKNSEFTIKTYINNNNIIIKLTNFSPPIDEEIKEHLFQKYITGSNKYQKVGFGLGMYLSKKIVEAHGGSIYYEGENTKNIFKIELPINANNEDNQIIW